MLLNALNDLGHLGDTPKVAQTILALMPDSGVMVIDTDMRIVLMQGPVFERHGYDPSSTVGRNLHDVMPASAWDRLGRHWGAALTGVSHTVDSESADGHRDYWLHFSPLQTKAGVVGAILIAQDISDRVLGREEMAHRLTQQAAVSSLGSLALQGKNLPELFEAAARVLHGALASDVVMVLETSAGRQHLGPRERRRGAAPPAGALTPRAPQDRRHAGGRRDAAHAAPSAETTSRAPGLAGEGMVSLVAAPVGAGATAFGELVACSRRSGAFSEDDLAFVESIANVLMATVERERAVAERDKEQALATHREEQLNDAQRLAQIGSWDTDFATHTHTLSENLRVMLEMDSCVCSDSTFFERTHPADRKRMRAIMSSAPEDNATSEHRVLLPNGRVRTFAAVFRSIRDEARHPDRAARHGQGRHRDAARRGGPQPLRGALPPGLRQRADRDVADRPPDHAPRARQRRLLRAWWAGRGRRCSALLRRDQPSRRPARAEAELPEITSGDLPQLVTEKRYPRPDGTEVWASVSITPVRELDGSIDVLFGQMVDITERKAREASLKAQLDEIAGLGEIRRAFEDDRFELHAQPIIDLATGETVQRELLIRMRGTDGALIPPGDFLPAAEKHGAIRDIDRWVIAQGADLAATGIDVEINISAASIGDPGLIADHRGASSSARAPTRRGSCSRSPRPR